MTQQPNWTLVANLGDVNVAQYGGFLVYVDATGVYPPEVELYEASDDETGGEVYRFILERDSASEWWYERLADVAASCGTDSAMYRAALESGDTLGVALVYRDLVGYFSPGEFDLFPRRLTEAEAEERYAGVRL